MLIDKLIEKAFSDGYEYAQKEFAVIAKGNILNKAKRNPNIKKLAKANDGGKSFFGAIEQMQPKTTTIFDVDMEPVVSRPYRKYK